MDPIAPLQQSNPTPAPAVGATDAGVISSDFETFLVMLTTQLENQDPLNPLDSTDFAVQLATFSGVEQQVRTNDLLQEMILGLGASGVAQLAGWVGMEARIDAPVEFNGSPVRLAPVPDPAAEAAWLIVLDDSGREIARETLPPTEDQILWAGTRSDGSPLPNGTYRFKLESLVADEVISTKPVEHYALIQEARQGISGTEIVTATGAILPATDVTALRRPDTTG